MKITNSYFRQELDKVFETAAIFGDRMEATEIHDFIQNMPDYNDNSLASIIWWYMYGKVLFGQDKIKENTYDILQQKGDEYAEENNRYENFEEAEEYSGIAAIECLNMFKLKHYVWMKKKVKANVEPINHHQLLEHVGDILNYTMLGYIYEKA